MKNKEYTYEPPITPIVAEPAITYGYAETSPVSHRSVKPERFEDEWNRSLTIEEFRALCKKELKEIYAAL